jgi:hypothetical protein
MYLCCPGQVKKRVISQVDPMNGPSLTPVSCKRTITFASLRGVYVETKPELGTGRTLAVY